MNKSQLDQDFQIMDLKKKLSSFLERSDIFAPEPMIEILPQGYLYEQKAFLLAKAKKYKDAFGICIDQLSDVELAMKVAHRAYKWH